MRTSNPILNSKIFQQAGARTGEVMSVQGTVNKTALLLGLALCTSVLSWNYVGTNPAAANGLMMLGAIGGLVMAIATAFAPRYAMFTAPAYALLQGAFLGSISVIFNAMYPGIVFSAVGLTFGVMAAMLMAYTSGVIQVTDRFRTGIFAATGGIALFYFSAMILGFFGVDMSLIFGSGLFGIAFSLFVVAIAALNLALDFDFIEQGSRHGLPKQMEWMGAFGLMVTLVWLYIEILRLLAKLNDRR